MKAKDITPEQIAMMRDFYTRMTLNNSGCGTHFIGGTILLIISLLLTACTTTKYVPVIEQRTDTLIQVKTQRDSVYLKDSVFVNQYVKGDTVFRDRDRWHTEYRDRWRTDTMYVSRNDSIPVPYPVEKKLTKWQAFCIDYGKVTLGVSIAAVIALVLLLLRWLRRRDR